jgi:hypothetical protein
MSTLGQNVVYRKNLPFGLSATCFKAAGILLGLFFNPENRSDMFLRSID